MLKKMNALIFTLVLIAAAGCQAGSEEGNSDPGSSLNQDISDITKSALVADYGEEGSDLADAYRLGTGNEPDGDKTEGCGHHCSHRQKCGPTHDIDIITAWTFTGCDGNPQNAYDNSTTASVGLISDATGTLTLPRMTKTFTRHADITVSGLCGDNKDFTVNGTASSDSKITFSANKNHPVRYYSVEKSADISDVVISTVNYYLLPVSGTITIVMTIEKATDSDFTNIIFHAEKTVVITFNGTTEPEIIIE